MKFNFLPDKSRSCDRDKFLIEQTSSNISRNKTKQKNYALEITL